MQIVCPHCGPRDLSEFTCQGDANRTYPADDAPQEEWNAYVYDRTNVCGLHREFWQHSGGCRQHLIVVRNTMTHEIQSVETARGEQV